MSNGIEKYSAPLQAANGRKAKSTDEEITMALAPLFIQYPNLDASDEWLKLQCAMYRDIPADKLARGVVRAIANDITGFPPAPGVIRKYAEDTERIPGPRNDVDPTKLKPIPQKMFRLDPEEDRRQRMAQLKRTKDWGRYYGA